MKRQACGAAVTHCLGCLHTISRYLDQTLASLYPGGQQMMAQVNGSLPSVWETQTEFLSLGFSLSLQLQLLAETWEVNQQTESILSLPFKRIDEWSMASSLAFSCSHWLKCSKIRSWSSNTKSWNRNYLLNMVEFQDGRNMGSLYWDACPYCTQLFWERNTASSYNWTFSETILLIYEVPYVTDRPAAESVLASEQRLPIAYKTLTEAILKKSMCILTHIHRPFLHELHSSISTLLRMRWRYLTLCTTV